MPGFPRKNIPGFPGGGCKVSYDFVSKVTSVTLYPQNVSFRASPDSMGGDMHTRKLIDQFVDNLSLKSHNSGQEFKTNELASEIICLISMVYCPSL